VVTIHFSEGHFVVIAHFSEGLLDEDTSGLFQNKRNNWKLNY